MGPPVFSDLPYFVSELFVGGVDFFFRGIDAGPREEEGYGIAFYVEFVEKFLVGESDAGFVFGAVTDDAREDFGVAFYGLVEYPHAGAFVLEPLGEFFVLGNEGVVALIEKGDTLFERREFGVGGIEFIIETAVSLLEGSDADLHDFLVASGADREGFCVLGVKLCAESEGLAAFLTFGCAHWRDAPFFYFLC